MALTWKREPWRKLYVREEGSFAALPLFTRALAAELIKVCDDEGIIRTGGRPLAPAIAFQLGADLSDRRILERHLVALIQDGYLVPVPGSSDVQIRNFVPAQLRWDRVRGTHSIADERTTSSRESRDSTATVPREPREAYARTESSAEDQSTPAVPLETKRNETKRERGTPARRQAPRIELPETWEPGAEHRKLASELKLDVDREAAKFRDHAAGSGRKQARWPAAFSLWLRRSSEYAATTGSPRNGRPPPNEPPLYRVEDPYAD